MPGTCPISEKPKSLQEPVEKIETDHELACLMRNRPGSLRDGEAKIKVG